MQRSRLLLLIAALLLMGGVLVWQYGIPKATPAAVGTVSPIEPLPESIPTRLRIPTIGVDTYFVPLGLEEDGEVEVPEGYEEVGWYTYGPTPGEIGPAVVLGHVGSKYGPGVFTDLADMKVGEIIYIDREDGGTAAFEVTAVEPHLQSAFPTERVYGNIPYAGIRVITCSGTFNTETRRYDQVTVVFGRLVEVAG